MSPEKRVRLVGLMSRLPPVRNIQALKVYVAEAHPEMLSTIESILRDALVGLKPAQQIFRFLMIGFAAGRLYQQANPEAPADPHGYD